MEDGVQVEGLYISPSVRTCAMLSNFANCPPDILVDVFDDLDAQSLCSACLVCSSWTSTAQRVLVRKVKVRVTSPLRHELVNATLGRSELASLVRSLFIEYTSSLPRVIESVRSFPSLRHLDLSFPGFSSIEDPYILTTGTSAEARIESLRTANRAPVVVELIRAWPSLRFIDVTIRSPFKDELPPPAKNEFYEIHWRVNVLADNDMRDFFWAVAHSQDSLQILELVKLPPPDMFDQFLASYSNIRSLRLAFCPEEYAPALSHLTRLEEFQLGEEVSDDILSNLCPSLEHLSVFSPLSITFEAFLTSHPRLRRLTLHNVNPIRKEFIDLCRKCGIDIHSHRSYCLPHAEVIHFCQSSVKLLTSRMTQNKEMEPVSTFLSPSAAAILSGYDVLES